MIFRNTSFDFTNKVGPDIGSFRIDTSAHTSEQSDRRSSEAESGQHRNDSSQICLRANAPYRRVNNKQHAKPQHSESNDSHAHHASSGESDFKCFPESISCGVGGSNVRLSGDSHPDETRKGRTESSQYE